MQNQYIPDQQSGVQRGIIVVDTNVLFNLTAEVSSSRPDEPSKRLLDIFLHLARNGYKIVVPEMVAYESCGVLREGSGINHYFSTKKKALSDPMEGFLHEAVLSNLVQIVPPNNKDTTDAAVFIRTIHRIYNSNADLIDKRFRISITQSQSTRGFGETAAQQYIRFLENQDVPIFYLSDDKKALNAAPNIRNDLRVNILTTRSFLHTLLSNGTLTQAGFESLSFGKLVSKILKHSESLGMGSWLLNLPQYVTAQSRDVLTDSLQQISIQKDCANLPTGGCTEPAPQLPSQVEKFYRRYGGAPSATANL